MSVKNQKAQRIAQRRQKKLAVSITLVGLGGLILVALAVFLAKANQAPTIAVDVKGSGHLKVDKEEVNLGDVKLGQEVYVDFTLSNNGDQPLTLTETPYIEVLEGC